MSGRSGEPDLHDPHTFLPYVIKHLPHVHNNSVLESAVLTVVSKATRTHDPKAFTIPLLPHLTAVTLSVPFDRVLSYANAVLSLTRSLTSRRLFREVSSFLVELVSFTKRLLGHSISGPVPFVLPSFHASNIPPISITPFTISAALLVLSLHIPSTYSPPVPIFSSDVLHQSSAMSIRLWQVIGQHARGVVISLASRHELLSGQCGPQVASLSIHLLLRVFDPATATPVPASFRRRVADAAARAFSASPDSSGLLQLLSVASPFRRIPSDVWSSHVLSHVLRSGRASAFARSLSLCGRVDYSTGSSRADSESSQYQQLCPQAPVLVSIDDTPEPSAKRQRLDSTSTPIQSASQSHQSTSQASPSPEMLQGTCAPYKKYSYLCAPSVVLQRSFKALRSVSYCARDPKSLMVIAYATHYTADAFLSFSSEPPSSQVIAEWHAFEFPLSRVLVDLTKIVTIESSQGVWYSLLCLATAVTRLYRALRLFYGFDPAGVLNKRRIEHADWSSLRIAACTVLQKSLASFQRDRAGFPTNQLGILLLKIGQETISNRSLLADHITLSKDVAQLSEAIMDPLEPLASPARAKFLKGVHCTKYAGQDCSTNNPDFSSKSSLHSLLSHISRQLSENSILEPSALHAVGFEICFSVRCTNPHDYSDGTENNKLVLDDGAWKEAFDVIRPLINPGHSGDLVAASLHCLLCLAVHAPGGRLSECILTLVDAIWLLDEHRVCSTVLRILSYLLRTKKRSPKDSGAVEENGNRPDGSSSVSLGFVHECLLEKLSSCTKKFEELSALNAEESHCLEGLNSRVLSLYLALPFDEASMPIVSGAACSILLRAVTREISSWASSQSILNPGDMKSSQFNGDTSMMTIWNHVVSVAIMLSENQFSHCGRNGSGQTRYTEGLRIQFSHSPGSLIQSVTGMFSSRLRHWAPISLNRLLDDKNLALNISILMGERDVQAFWLKLPRHVITLLLQKQDVETLNKLSARSDSSLRSLVEKYAADSLARIIMNSEEVPDDTSLVSCILGKSVEDLLRAKSGKVVQKLVMEFGGSSEVKAKNALAVIGKVFFSEQHRIQDDSLLSGAMVANHFMLVMDAVNRSLFQSKATQIEQLRYLGTLNTVLLISKKHVHAFIPKILASLKLALDSFHENSVVCMETIRVWVSFLHILGTVRVTDHLASILATLLPYFTQFEDILYESLSPFVSCLPSTKFSDRSLVALFLRLTSQPQFSHTASLLEGTNRLNKADATPDCETDVNMKQLEECCKNVCRIITQYENGSVEVMASKFFLGLLRANRKTVADFTKAFCMTTNVFEQKAQKGVPSIMKTLIEHIHRSKNRECQRVLLQCMGEIGAIDPAVVTQVSALTSLPLDRSNHTKTHDYPLNIFALVAHLLDSFLIPVLAQGENQTSSLKSNLNRAGLSIQELLRVCGCRKSTAIRASKTADARSSARIDSWETILVGETKEENAVLFWENLPKATRDVICPYLSEPFDVQQYKDVFGGASAGNLQLACQPVWSRIKAVASVGVLTDAHEWRRQFVVQLVDFIGTRGSFGEVFRALRPVLRYVDNLTAFVFPLVLTGALDIQKETQNDSLELFIIRELSEVLTEASSPQIIFTLLDTLRDWREVRCLIQGKKLANEKFGNSASGTPAAVKRRHAIPIYTEYTKDLDPLSAFIDLDRGRVAPSLSLLVQARCAFRAKSFSRAIFLAESHVRNLRRRSGLAIWAGLLDTVLAKTNTTSVPQCEEAEACSILQKSFAELEDADSMRGIAALRSSSSISELVIDTEVSGQFNETLTLYERAIAEDPHSVLFHRGFLNCLMTLGHWETMLSHAQGLAYGTNLHEVDLLHTAEANGIEAAWRLGRWDQTRAFVCASADHEIRQDETELNIRPTWALDFSKSFGTLMGALHTNDSESFRSASEVCRDHLLPPLLRAAREGYSRTYPIVARLHAVADVMDAFEQLQATLQSDKTTISNAANAEQRTSDESIVRLASIESRVRITAPSLKLREPILSVKRVCVERLGSDTEAALVNLALATLAKENDNLRLAATFSFKAIKMSDGNDDIKNLSVMENARIEKAKGASTVALTLVKNEIDRLRELLVLQKNSNKNSETICKTNDRLSSALVLAGSWIEEGRSESSEVILKYFEEAASCGSSREDPFYAMGKHYDSLLQASINADVDIKLAEEPSTTRTVRRPPSIVNQGPEHHSHHVPMVIQNYARTLCNGHSRIFEALPRMLTVWFDYYTGLDDNFNGYRGLAVEEEVRDVVKRSFQKIPLYMWMTAIPQLMSRILHNRKVVREELSNILARVLCQFPDASFWTVAPSSQLKSSVTRKKATGDILTLAIGLVRKERSQVGRERAKQFKTHLHHKLAVLNAFVEICEIPGSKDRRGHTDDCSNDFAKLKSHLRTAVAPNPIIPTLKSLTVRLPDGSSEEHRPFEIEAVRIMGIDDHVLVMSSLMCPKRITLLGSDGRQYRYLAKRENNGDMRRDSRVVEFLTIMNRLLSEDRTSLAKGLQLKAYAVLPLTEETGMIEWVNDLSPLRTIVGGEHAKIDGMPSQSIIKQKYESTADKRKFLQEWAMMKFPAVLDKYFVNEFGAGDAQNWLAARNEWTKSCAVWSMSGQIVGLGDRHGENVLIETTSGQCVHVDFAMLFEKGLKLRVPEVVPFRLTQNMVSAMGICGYEGVFRTVCEVVMRVVRRHGDALLSRLESFLYDPLADWGSSQTHGCKAGVMATREGWQARATVKSKLTGMVDNSGLALSIEGQVERLIKDAINLDNLSKMYIWWSAWI